MTTTSDFFSVMTYNVTNYNQDKDRERGELVARAMLRNADVDVVAVQELEHNNGHHALHSRIKQTWDQSVSDDLDENGQQDVALFWKSSAFQMIQSGSVDVSPNNLKDALWVQLQHIRSKNVVDFYVIHLKASSGGQDEATRATQMGKLLNHVEQRFHDQDTSANYVVVLGDCNFYGHNQAPYQRVAQSTAVYDPVGPWRRNDVTFTQIYTQATRLTHNDQFAAKPSDVPNWKSDSPVTGGLDDRFDFIFVDKYFAVLNYHVVGHTQSVFNKAHPDRDLVSASDHLPVRTTLVFTDELH